MRSERRGVRPGDEFVDDAALHADAASRHRGAVIGNRFHLVSGMMQSAGALVFLDPTLSTHTAMHDILELQFGAPPPTALPRARPRRLRSSAAAASATAAPSAATTAAAAPSQGATKVYTRYNVNSPQGQVMLAKYAQAIEIMRELPQHDQRSWKWWWNTHWVKGFPAPSGITPRSGRRK